MQEIVMSPATLLVLLAIVAGAVLAVRRLVRRGLCDCDDHRGEGCRGCRGCPGDASSCPAADSLVARARQEASS